MAKTEQNDTMYVNNQRTLEYTVTDEDNSNNPLDLTPYTAGAPADIKWTLSRIDQSGNVLKDSPVLEKKYTTAGQITVSGASNEVAGVNLLSADTASLTAGDYWMELELFDAAGERVVIATGTMTLLVNVVNT